FPLSSILPLQDGQLAIPFDSLCCCILLSNVSTLFVASSIVDKRNFFMLFKKCSFDPFPSPIFLRYDSHFAVIEGLESNVPSTASLNISPLFVMLTMLLLIFIYFLSLTVSMMPDLVASVPIPSTSFKISLSSSSSTIFPAVFIKLINCPSVYGFGGVVKRSTMFGLASTVSFSLTFGSGSPPFLSPLFLSLGNNSFHP